MYEAGELIELNTEAGWMAGVVQLSRPSGLYDITLDQGSHMMRQVKASMLRKRGLGSQVRVSLSEARSKIQIRLREIERTRLVDYTQLFARMDADESGASRACHNPGPARRPHPPPRRPAQAPSTSGKCGPGCRTSGCS